MIAAMLAAIVLMAGSVTALDYDVSLDGAIAVSGAFAWTMAEIGKPALAPLACRWCAHNGFDDGVRNALRWSDPSVAATLSDVGLFAITPLASGALLAIAAAHDHAFGGWPVDLLLVAEATALAADVDEVVKYAAGRPRPFVAARSFDDEARLHAPDDNLSFFSGHTTVAFALAVSSGTIATMRGYRFAPLVWAVGLPLAAAVGWLRIAGDQHYLTDVLVGAAVGSAFGALVPLVFHRSISIGHGRARVVPMGAGASIVVTL